MVITSKQIIRGVGSWIDAEILPSMHGPAQYAVGVAAAMLSKKGEALLDKARDNEIVKTLGISRDGGYDLDELRTVMLERYPADGIRIDADQINSALNRFLGKLAPIINYKVQGGITFHRSDLERLLNAIMEG